MIMLLLLLLLVHCITTTTVQTVYCRTDDTESVNSRVESIRKLTTVRPKRAKFYEDSRPLLKETG